MVSNRVQGDVSCREVKGKELRTSDVLDILVSGQKAHAPEPSPSRERDGGERHGFRRQDS